MPQPKKSSGGGTTAASTTTPAESGDNIVEALLDQAGTLQDEREALFKRINANRQSLRNLAATGLLNPGQAEEVDVFYPPVKRTKKSDNGTAAE